MFKAKKRVNRRIKPPVGARVKSTFSRMKKTVLAIFVVAALSAGAWYGYRELTTTRFFAIKKIEVSGIVRATNERIVELSGIKPGDNLIALDTSSCAAQVAKEPWVSQAQVVRSGLNSVRIVIKEKVPVALLKLDGLYVMDEAGEVFKKLGVEDAVDLPVITGISDSDKERVTRPVIALVEFLKQRKGFNIDRVSEIRYDRTFGFSVYTLDEGVRLDVGTDGYEDKLSAFEKVLQARGGSLSGVEAMDLTGSRGVIVKFKTNMA